MRRGPWVVVGPALSSLAAPDAVAMTPRCRRRRLAWHRRGPRVSGRAHISLQSTRYMYVCVYMQRGGRVVLLAEFSSLAALGVVILTTPGAVGGRDFVGMMTFPFRCMCRPAEWNISIHAIAIVINEPWELKPTYFNEPADASVQCRVLTQHGASLCIIT